MCLDLRAIISSVFFLLLMIVGLKYSSIENVLSFRWGCVEGEERQIEDCSVDRLFVQKMPHRTTYFFPRQFPDRNFSASSKLVEDHEKKELVGDDGNSEREDVTLKSQPNNKGESTFSERGFHSYGGISHGVTGDRIHGKQLADFVKWLSEKKKKEKSPGRADPVKARLYDDDGIEDEVCHRLLPAAAADQRQDSLRRCNGDGKERGFERQVSLQRLSSEGSTSYAGSLYSGTTLDGNWSSATTAILKDAALVKEEEEEEEIGGGGLFENAVAQRYKEGYYLQIMFAKRLTDQATLVTEPLLSQQRRTYGSSDAEIVSFRLWVCDLIHI